MNEFLRKQSIFSYFDYNMIEGGGGVIKKNILP